MTFRMSGWICPDGGFTKEKAERAIIDLGVYVHGYDPVTGKFSVSMIDDVWVAVQNCAIPGLVSNRYLTFIRGKPAH